MVDTAGRDSRELRTGITAAHLLLIPFRPSQPDLDTLPYLKDIILQAKDLNPQLKEYGLLTMVPTHPGIREADEAQEYWVDFPSIPLLTTKIYDRKVYRDSMSCGKGVTELTNEKAKQEIESLLGELLHG